MVRDSLEAATHQIRCYSILLRERFWTNNRILLRENEAPEESMEMTRKRILYISWQGGMGHITRDIAIAREIRRQIPEAELSWLASPLATQVLEEARERLLPESALSADYNSVFEKIMDGYRANVMKYAFYARKAWAHNVGIFKQVTSKYHFDLVIGDEAYEIAFALCSKRIQIEHPFVMICDFIGAIGMAKNPLEKLFIYLLHRNLSLRVSGVPLLSHFFVGELEDVPDMKFGFLLPNCREWAKEKCKFLGYVIRFDPAEYTDKAKIRAKLGYGQEPLVVCALGGASAGKELLELCGRAYPLLKKEIPDLRMVMVCGGLLYPESLDLPKGVDIRGYVSDLYEHFAASDLAVVVGGGTSTIELTALRCPFLYFPLEQHFEQHFHVAGRLARHKAGVRMSYYETTPEVLAAEVISNLGKKVTYAPIPTDGAQKAARLINQLLSK